MQLYMCVSQRISRQQRREKWDREGSSGGESHGTMLLRAAVALPDLPPDCFQLVLEPWAFWVLEAGPDPTIPPAPHPAA